MLNKHLAFSPQYKEKEIIMGFSAFGNDTMLGINHSILSANQNYELIMQEDGNLVLYRIANKHALWATGTNGQDVEYAIMQTDGNLVLYSFLGSDNKRKPIWASGTEGNPFAYCVVQDDGNLVIYRPDVPVWASQTNQ